MGLYGITARGLFEVLDRRLRTALVESGFSIVAERELQKENSNSSLRYKVIVVDLPRISSEMIALSPQDGILFPACVSLIETYPGELRMVVANPTEQYAADNSQLRFLANEVTDLLCTVVRTFARDERVAPDLVTSWE